MHRASRSLIGTGLSQTSFPVLGPAILLGSGQPGAHGAHGVELRLLIYLDDALSSERVLRRGGRDGLGASPPPVPAPHAEMLLLLAYSCGLGE